VEGFQSEETKAPDKRPRADAWTVYNRYEIRHSENGRCIYAPKVWYEGGWFHKNPPKEFGEGREWYTLSQGMSGGGLFSDFARLVEDEELDIPPQVPLTNEGLDTDKNAHVARKWAQEWGVLGLTRKDDGWYDTRGGTGDTVAAFAFQAWVANSILRLYEEATREDGNLDTTVIADLLIAGGFSPRSVHHYPRRQEDARENAIRACEMITHARVRDYCYPALFREPGRFKYTQGFGSANLLGAIWMGMFWILHDRQTDRCRNPECNHIIPYRRTPVRWGSKKNDRSEGYATRKDKVYCRPKCEKRHYYLLHTKPAREAAKAKRSS
jgi:hypothetical protein